MKKIYFAILGGAVTLGACDLQPKIMSLPDSVGDFISQRYPALLADPNTNPEIYNSAATDYGVYASPELYGTAVDTDYVTYASVNDYIVPPQSSDSKVGEFYGTEPSGVKNTDDYLVVPKYEKTTEKTGGVVQAGDTLYSLSKRYKCSVDDLVKWNNLVEPYVLSVGQNLYVSQQTENAETEIVPTVSVKKVPEKQTVTRVDVKEVTVANGDTLYSLSRKYSVPVNDLAVMNNLSAPFTLSVGQTLRVPDLSDAPIAQKQTVSETAIDKKTTVAQNKKSGGQVENNVKQPEKISSDPSKKLPSISARSSSKFSWPVQGKVLSGYGAKASGLFNDGINIGAALGTPVKAAENGVVAYAGNEVKGMGNLIIIQHDAGWMTVYAHMDSMNVKRGNRVSVGQKIGAVGKTGKVDEPQLHFEIRKGTKAYNPSSYLKK